MTKLPELVRILYLLPLLLVAVQAFAQVNPSGIPFVQNYPPELYGAAEQNWAIVQDSSGIMYFGNNDNGVLEYDGQSWRQIRLPGNPIVRSLAIHGELIYVGAVNEFGYLEADETGLLQYRSLIEQLDSSERIFADVWKIYSIGDRVYFSTELDRLFAFENLRLVQSLHIPGLPLFTFPLNGKVIAGSYLSGLLELDRDSFRTLPGGDFFSRKAVLALLPYDGPWWMAGTISDGVYLYHSVTGEISSGFPSREINAYLRENYLYHAIELPGKKIAFATLGGGALVVDSTGQLIDRIDARSGLENEVVAYLYHNGDRHPGHSLWMALSSGIARAETGSPFRVFDKTFGLRSSVLDIEVLDDILYVATLTGLYYLDRKGPGIPRLVDPGLIDQSCWSLIRFTDPVSGKESILAGTQQGIFEIRDTSKILSMEDTYRFTEEPGQYYQCFSLHRSNSNPEKIYLGLKSGLASISRSKGTWVKDPVYRDFPAAEVRSINDDEQGTVWCGTMGDGVIRMEMTGTDTLIRRFDLSDGLPFMKGNRVYATEHGIIFGTQKGIFRFDTTSATFVPDTRFPEKYHNGQRGIHHLVWAGDSTYWIVCTDEKAYRTEHFRFLPGGTAVIDSLPYRRLPNREIDAILPLDEHLTWFGISNELYSFRRDQNEHDRPAFKALVRKATANGDSVLFNGSVNGPVKPPSPHLPYRLNQVGFEFAAPFFVREEEIQFSYLLEGLHDHWSAWTSDSKVVFNNLREGKYTFYVRAMNIYGQVSSNGTYSFRISPPWYRSIPALFSYLLLAGLFVLFIVKWNARRLIREKQRLEQLISERTSEVMRQKTEIEKQRDLAQRQKRRIENQNRDIKDSIKYARRIQNAILPPEDFLSDFIPECFVMNLPKDIVSGDFYWFTHKDKKIVVAVADCTGHGVPGAFMSMLGMAYLNEIVNKNNMLNPTDILYYLRLYVINSLHQRGEEGQSRDGMDISLFTIHTKNLMLDFAGAYNPLYIIREGELHVMKADRMPIGIHEKITEPFTGHSFRLKKGDCIYAMSDGFADQFGGEKNKKFTTGNLKKFLLEISGKPMKIQREILENHFLEWKGKNAQVDDILVVGLRI